MKKLLHILGAASIIISPASTLVSCGGISTQKIEILAYNNKDNLSDYILPNMSNTSSSPATILAQDFMDVFTYSSQKSPSKKVDKLIGDKKKYSLESLINNYDNNKAVNGVDTKISGKAVDKFFTSDKTKSVYFGTYNSHFTSIDIETNPVPEKNKMSADDTTLPATIIDTTTNKDKKVINYSINSNYKQVSVNDIENSWQTHDSSSKNLTNFNSNYKNKLNLFDLSDVYDKSKLNFKVTDDTDKKPTDKIQDISNVKDLNLYTKKTKDKDGTEIVSIDAANEPTFYSKVSNVQFIMKFALDDKEKTIYTISATVANVIVIYSLALLNDDLDVKNNLKDDTTTVHQMLYFVPQAYNFTTSTSSTENVFSEFDITNLEIN